MRVSSRPDLLSDSRGMVTVVMGLRGTCGAVRAPTRFGPSHHAQPHCKRTCPREVALAE